MAGFDPNQPRDEQGQWTSNGSNAVAMGVAATIVLSALAGGGIGGATSASGSVGEYGPRTSRSQPEARINRAGADARTSGITDSLKITSRLKRVGYKVEVQATRDDKNCVDHSDGEVQSFFRKHECNSLYRELIEVKNKRATILFGMATIEMADYQTAIDLKTLLDQAVKGKIIQLSPGNGKYQHFSFTNSLFTTTVHDTTVVIFDVQIVSGTVSNFILSLILTDALVSLGERQR